MSDEAGVAVEAPPVADSAAEPIDQPVEDLSAAEGIRDDVAPSVELEEGTSRSARMRNARKRAEARESADREIAEASRERARGQARDEAGRFAREEQEAAEAAPVEDIQATTEQAVAEPVDTAQVEATPAGFVDIPLPEDHPLRARGDTHIRAPASEETKVRNGINAAVKLRRAEVEHEALVREHAQLRARMEAISNGAPVLDSDPTVQTLLDQIREAPGFGDDLAERVKAGLEALQYKNVQEAEYAAVQQLGVQRTTDEFMADVYQQAPQVFKVWGENNELQYRLPDLMRQYAKRVDERNEQTGGNVPPTVSEFIRWSSQAYAADPRVRTQIESMQATNAERERAKIRAEVEAELKRKEDEERAATAKRHATRPPLTSRPTSTRPVTESAPERAAPQGPGTYRNQAKARIRERFAK